MSRYIVKAINLKMSKRLIIGTKEVLDFNGSKVKKRDKVHLAVTKETCNLRYICQYID